MSNSVTKATCIHHRKTYKTWANLSEFPWWLSQSMIVGWRPPSITYTNSWLSLSRISCSTPLSHARAAPSPQAKSFQVNASKPWGYHLSPVLQQRDLGRFREPPQTLLSLFVALERTLLLWAPMLHRFPFFFGLIRLFRFRKSKVVSSDQRT
jgi:hypothetical protein